MTREESRAEVLKIMRQSKGNGKAITEAIQRHFREFGKQTEVYEEPISKLPSATIEEAYAVLMGPLVKSE